MEKYRSCLRKTSSQYRSGFIFNGGTAPYTKQEASKMTATLLDKLNLADPAQQADPSIDIFCGTVTHESTPFVARKENEAEDEYLQRVKENTDIAFENDTDLLLEKMLEKGYLVYRYRFSFESAMPHVHACHCFDIPFLLRNFDRWEGSPFLQGIDMEAAKAVSDQYSRAFVKFMEGGDLSETDLINICIRQIC